MFKQIGIIGGTGKMGQMFNKCFVPLGHKPLLSDENSPALENELITKSDLIILSVPIDKSVAVMKRIGAHLRNNQLLIDFTSVKKDIVPQMQKYAAEIIPCHPMFGPMASVAGQTIIMMPDGNSKHFSALKHLFEKIELKVVILKNWQEHDKLMSYIQGLMHFVHIVFTRALKHRGIEIDSLMSIASPVYRANFAFACRIIGRDPKLYSHILMDNKYNKVVLTDFISQANQTLKLIEDKNETEINNIIYGLQDYLGEFAGEFSKESDFLVSQLTGYQKSHE